MGIGFKDYFDEALQPPEYEEECVCCELVLPLNIDLMCESCAERCSYDEENDDLDFGDAA